ncbi:uncharacterized protein LOC131936141 [Physella acuta]|uniref:uncharacterized protein LOC131936141 n=1 Tax=Physella acuta TaxID=109671 RepID=UPI0027DEAA09|nr:uncharacterized protein LOC131936141 [Physella acuta]
MDESQNTSPIRRPCNTHTFRAPCDNKDAPCNADKPGGTKDTLSIAEPAKFEPQPEGEPAKFEPTTVAEPQAVLEPPPQIEQNPEECTAAADTPIPETVSDQVAIVE